MGLGDGLMPGTGTTNPDKLVIADVAEGLDGTYGADFIAMISIGDDEALTAREAHQVKRLTGLRMGELGDAFQAGDYDVVIAFAVVTLSRHGVAFDENLLLDAPSGRITLEIGDRPEEDDAVPPAVTPDAVETEPIVEPSGSSGSDSEAELESLESDQRVTGVPV